MHDRPADDEALSIKYEKIGAEVVGRWSQLYGRPLLSREQWRQYEAYDTVLRDIVGEPERKRLKSASKGQ
jgi:hypothetical protein